MKTLLILLSLIFTINANALEKVKLQLKWKTQFQFAGFIAAKEKGFFKDESIEVELLEYTHGTDTLLDLEEGKTSFAISDSSIILEVVKGKRLVALMAIYQESPYILMSLKSSNITTLSDINNKKVALYDDMNGKAVDSMLKLNNINFNRIPITNQLLQLQNGETDLALGYRSNEPYMAKEKGMELNILNLNDYGFNRYGDILFTLEDTVKKRPELVAKMYRATKRGFIYAFSNIDEMVDIIYDKYNTQKKSKEAYRYEADILKKLIGYNKEFGKLDPAKLDSIGYMYAYSGSIKYKKKNLKNFIYKYDLNKNINLTKAEQEYLDSIETISMCYDTTFEPYTMIKNGKPIGVSVDYLKLVEKKINKKFNFIYSDNLTKQFTMAYEKKCSTIPVMQREPNSLEYLQPTISAGKDNLVLITKKDEPYIFNMEKIKDKKIGINREFTHLSEYLDKRYPYINYIKIDGYGLEEVKNGELFGCIGASIIMNYHLTKKFKNSLKVIKDYPDSYIEGAIGVRTDEPILLSILNKAMATIDTVKQEDVFDKWIEEKYKKIIDYTLVWQIIFISFLILSGIIYWNRRLNIEINRRKYAEEKLKKVNSNLEDRIKESIEEIHNKEILLQNQSRLAQMGEMIAMIAHQWRQPLSAIGSAMMSLRVTQKMQKKELSDALKREAFLEFSDQKIAQVSEHVAFLSETIDNFRDFFKPDNVKQEIHPHTLIAKTLTLIQSSIDSKAIKLTQRLDATREISIHENQLMQVLMNILSNAIDNFEINETINPYISITVEQDTQQTTILVCDNGGGISETILPYIFDPYYSTKEKKNSTGLGLYMSKIMIEEYNDGYLKVNNHRGGVCFEIVLNG